MRKIIISAFMTLDGVMQAPGGPDEDTDNGFDQGGWSFGYWDDTIGVAMGKEWENGFESLLGRKTYEVFASTWPNREGEGADILNNAKKYVISTTIKNPKWNNTEVISDNIIQEIKKLKSLDGPELQIAGSSELIQSLLKHDLIDEFRLKIYPVVIGNGKRLFGIGAIPVGLKLKESTTTTSGVIIATYERDGDIKSGSFME